MNNIHTDYKILKEVYEKYVIGVPLIRAMLMPTLLCMIIARYLEVVLGEMMQKVSSRLSYQFQGSCMDLVGKYFLVSIFSCLLIELQGFIFTGPIQRAYRTASKDTFKTFLNLEHHQFHKYGMGEITTTIERKSLAVSEIIDVLVLNFFPVLFVIVLSTWKIYKILGFLTAVILNITLVIYTFITIRMAEWRNRIRKELNKDINNRSDQLFDSLNNYDLVVSYNNEMEEEMKYDRRLMEVEKSNKRLWQTFYLLNFLQRLVFGLQTCSIIYIGVKGIAGEVFTSDQLVLYLSISRILASNLDKLGYMYARFSQAMINAKLTFKEFSDRTKLYPIRGFYESIVFKNVNFVYNGRTISENINFEIKKGDNVAIIGGNGKGKSTLIKSLLKFNQYGGSIKIDGDELKYISCGSIRKLISYVPQDSLLLNETVEYNMCYGNNELNIGEVQKVSEEYGIDAAIKRLDNGYKTIVGSRGTNLSGGERQKISFIRAILKDADIFILDEPTANLDKISELTLIKEIIKRNKEKTIIMVVHSLSLLKYFNRIIYLEECGSTEVDLELATQLMSKK